MEHRGPRKTGRSARVGGMIASILTTYLRAYRSLIAVQSIDNDSATLSFPFHLAASHRIEITVTDLGKKRCVLSDAGRTLGEIEDAGHSLTEAVKDRLERIARVSDIRIVKGHLLLESTYDDLGVSIQRFLEISKMIGDVYLVHKQRADADDELRAEVRSIFDSTSIKYRQGQKLRGRIEDHRVDLLLSSNGHLASPNGHTGVAVSVIGGQNTHALARIWYCQCDDIRSVEENENIKIALVYDVRFEKWSSKSTELLAAKADVVIPGDSVERLPDHLASQGLIRPMKLSERPPA
jgi:hypothetical protein